MQFYEQLGYFSSIILFLITLLYGLRTLNHTKWERTFFTYLLFLTIQDIVSKFLWFYGHNNLHVLHVFNYLEWATLSVYYWQFNRNNRVLPLLAIASLLSLFVGSIFIYAFDEFQMLGFFGLKLFIVITSLREVVLHQIDGQQRCYWINLGLALSAAVNMIIFSFGKLLIKVDQETQVRLWLFNALVFLISLSLYLYQLHPKFKWKTKS